MSISYQLVTGFPSNVPVGFCRGKLSFVIFETSGLGITQNFIYLIITYIYSSLEESKLKK